MKKTIILLLAFYIAGSMIAPHVFIDFSFDDYKNGIDPLLEEIIEFTSK